MGLGKLGGAMILQAFRHSLSPTDTDDISWRIGIFALERLRPDPNNWLTPNALWAEYFLWCRKKDVQPLPVSNFLQKFDEAATSLGVRKLRSGDEVGYAFKPAV
jgi:hypothetical protein